MIHYNKLGRNARKALAGLLVAANVVGGVPVYAAEPTEVQNPSAVEAEETDESEQKGSEDAADGDEDPSEAVDATTDGTTSTEMPPVDEVTDAEVPPADDAVAPDAVVNEEIPAEEPVVPEEVPVEITVDSEILKAEEDGWHEDGNGFYYVESGEKLTSTWKQMDGSWYYLGSDGYRYADGRKYISKDMMGEYTYSYYCFDADGRMQTGWYEEYGNKYYYMNDGKAASGVQEVDGATYYFGYGGEMQTNNFLAG